MKKEKTTLADWGKEHKEKLIIAGVSITVIIAISFGIKNHRISEGGWTSCKKFVKKPPEIVPAGKTEQILDAVSAKDNVETSIRSTSRIPHHVSGHFRNLPKGQKASPEKIKTAAEHGHELSPKVTWVVSYETGRRTA